MSRAADLKQNGRQRVGLGQLEGLREEKAREGEKVRIRFVKEITAKKTLLYTLLPFRDHPTWSLGGSLLMMEGSMATVMVEPVKKP